MGVGGNPADPTRKIVIPFIPILGLQKLWPPSLPAPRLFPFLACFCFCFYFFSFPSFLHKSSPSRSSEWAFFPLFVFDNFHTLLSSPSSRLPVFLSFVTASLSSPFCLSDHLSCFVGLVASSVWGLSDLSSKEAFHATQRTSELAVWEFSTPALSLQQLSLQRSNILASSPLLRGRSGVLSGPTTNSMAESSFPATNTRLRVGTKDDMSSAFQKISEEDEYEVTSPTDSTFRSANANPASSSSADNLFGGSVFGEATGSGGGGVPAGGIRFTRSPFGGPAGDGDEEQDYNDLPEGDRPTGGPNQGFPNNYALGRRTSVSAESLNPTSAGSDSWQPPYHPKSEEQLSRLKVAVSNNFLFSHLDDDQFKTVLDALVEKPIPAKDIKVISQGDAGDYFYIVENGHFDVHIHPSGSVQPGADGMGSKVGSIGPGGSFGELALMYNAPRAATIVSIDAKSTLWALDRITFRRILMDSAFQRRRMYEAFLEEVPLLSSLKPYERAKIADALDAIKYPSGSTIITEGDPGDAFYLLESGEADAFKAGIEGPVKSYRRGDYFGELALLDDKPRAASIIANTEVKVAKLGRDGFKRLLGPVEQIMRRTDYDSRPTSSAA